MKNMRTSNNTSCQNFPKFSGVNIKRCLSCHHLVANIFSLSSPKKGSSKNYKRDLCEAFWKGIIKTSPSGRTWKKKNEMPPTPTHRKRKLDQLDSPRPIHHQMTTGPIDCPQSYPACFFAIFSISRCARGLSTRFRPWLKDASR